MKSITDNEAYSIERITKQRLADLETLYISVYRRMHPAGYYLKKYDTVYTGKENLGFIAYDGKHRPVAYFGVVPCFLQDGKEIVPAAQAVDGMTDPGHRARGLFSLLLSKTIELCSAEGIRILFGFPNQDSYPPMIRSGWKETGRMDRFTIPVRHNFFSSVISRFSFADKKNDWYQHPVLRHYVLKLAGLPASVLAEGYAGVVRDEAFLKYRQYHETLVIGINNSCVWLNSRGDNLNIGDMEFSGSDKDFDILVATVKNIAGQMRFRRIHFQASSQTRFCKLFANRYEAIPSFPVLFRDFGAGIQLEKIKFTFADTDSF